MAVTEAKGKLVIIGGAEEREGECGVLKEFITLAGGARARIVVMTVATDLYKEAMTEYRAAFKSLGVDHIEAFDVSQRLDTQDEKALAALEKATGIFFTGGDQLKITALLGGTKMHDLLHERFRKGTVIAGTSAGAAMMSNSMFISGASDNNPRFGGMEIGPGMDFLVGAMIDTHFSQRGRMGRLLTAVAHYPQDLGFGIDENTAMVVEGREFRVVGEGAVTVVDAGAITFTNLPDIGEDESLALYDVKIHVLPEGHRFDLEKRAPIIEKRVKRNGQSKTSKPKGRAKG
ncbi:MAG TPA: cyanophycinase [Pyrinomonadaceae bacterium]|nr:cyanophycinase [Pyrinomonadaceae bacterium]